MKPVSKRKVMLAIVVAVAICLCLSIATVYHMVQEQQLEDLQEDALKELERNAGRYDDQSIVLSGTSKARAEELAEKFGAELRITKDGRFAKLTLPEGVTIRDVYAEKENRIYIEEMSADYQVSIAELESEEESDLRLPIRPQYTVSDSEYDRQTYLNYLNMNTVWNSYKGNGITVAVIDTGIDTDHPEFAGRISEYSYNATEDKIVKDWKDENGNPDWSLVEDEQGHGTAVTGVIAANMNSGSVVGIAPNVTIITIKAECDEYGAFKRSSDLVFGLYYAIERDVQVVNMSFGGGTELLWKAPVQLAYDSDVMLVSSAGNGGTAALTYPACMDKVIGVGALAENSWELAEYSNYGENSDLVAPGTTYTTLMGGGYGIKSGTSLSSPIVTGAIALYMQSDKYTTFEEVTEILYASCYDLGELGNDWDYGFGALDLSAFLLEKRGTVTYDMLTDELDNTEGVFIRGHALQEYPEPERLYAIFDGWYYDDTFTQAVEYYRDAFEGDLTLYAKWVNEDDGVPYTYVILDDGTVEIRSYTGHRRYITIPEKIEGRIVSSIGDFAFAEQTRLREVGLPSGLTKIGRFAFQNCANLITIQIPEGVKTIGESAFSGNIRLSSVAFLGKSQLTSIGNFAFASCGKLEKIELPAALKSINGSAFYGATALHTINVQKGNTAFTSLDGVLFNQSGSSLIAYPASHGASYTLPEQTKAIDVYAFAFAKIKAIDLAKVTTIGDSAFVYSSLRSLTIPDSVTSLGAAAFAQNSNLSSVTLGRGLTAISGDAFSSCASLREIEIPKGILSIGGSAFGGSGLTTVTFEEGSGLLQIREDAFLACALSQIEIPASVVAIGGGAFSRNPLTEVRFGENSVLQSIGDSAFAKCRLLQTISLPKGLVSIGEMAFSESGLRDVTIPASVQELGYGVFSFCSDLTSVTVEEENTVYHDVDGVVYTIDDTAIHTFPAGRSIDSYTLLTTVRTICPYAFAGTAKLGTAILPEGLTVIGEYGFYWAGINRITLPNSLVEIQQYAFANCGNLRSIHIPDNVLQIGRYAFAEDWKLNSVTFNGTAQIPRLSYACFAYSGITSFTVPANVSTMAQKVFEGCSKLTSVTFAKNSKLESISAYMFDGCSNLKKITFKQGSALTSIQAHGLEGMDKLTSIDFGDAKVTNIDNFAFRFCESLASLTLPETVTNIGRYAFYGCKNLSELTIPSLVEHIGSYAFLGTKDLDLYFASSVLPVYLDENWDHGTRGYYVGVTSVVTEGDYKHATLTSGDIAIIEYLGSDTHVDLTKLDFGAPITAIGGSAFKDSSVTSIVLPEMLTSIQAKAFMYSALEEITIPQSVTFIGREAFASTSIASLTFAEGSKLSVIEQYAFAKTKELSSVTLPKSLTTMGTGAFMESGLTTLVFEKGIKLSEIPQRAFAETKLTSVILPDSVTLVNHNAFNGVKTLSSVAFGQNDGIRLLSNAFYQTGLTSLHIPANVTYIGEYCFTALLELRKISVDAANPNYTAVDGLLLTKSGRKLISVPAGREGSLTVPASVEEIGFGAFEESKLSEIFFHEDANILTLGYRAFFKAENITEMKIPKSVVSIDYYAFAYCKNLKTVTFAEGNQLKGIYEGAFLGDVYLESIVIPDSIVEISDFAFYGCSKIDKLPISENNAIKGIYDYAFAYTGLKGEFTAPETLYDIGNYAFLGTKLSKVTIPDTNKKILIIGIGAFEDCNKLEEITLPFIGASYEDDEISWFGYIFGAGAYEANETYVPKSLKTVTITDGVTFIGVGGFANCTGLETINVPHSVSVLWSAAFLNTTARYELSNIVTTYYRFSSISEATASHFGKGISGYLILSDSVTSIGDYAFNGCTGLINVEIPDSVTLIGYSAFSRCTGLTSIEIPDSVTTISFWAFSHCTGLKSVVIGNSVTLIDGGAFDNCTGLTSIEIPDSVTSIGSSFRDCTGLTSIELGDGVTSIDSRAFKGCTGLESITVSKDNTAYCSYDGILYDKPVTRFVHIPSKISGDIIIPEGVTSIDNSAFYNCSGLTSIEIPDSVTSIGSDVFNDCSGLTSVVIGDGVTSIGNSAFYYCSSLTNIEIPDSVKTIGTYAFYGCRNLTSIEIPDNVTTIDSGAFYGCDSLYQVRNNSSLAFTIGSSSHGYIAYNAKVIIDKNGNKTHKNQNSDFEIIDTEDGFRFIKENGKYTLRAYMGSKDTITLPASIEGNTYEIYYFRGGKKVIIPEGVTSIGSSAFSGCSSLTSIVIPNGVTSIGSYAFEGCSGLTSIVIPNGVTSIGSYAFFDCTGLKQITLSENVVNIGVNAFSASTEIVFAGNDAAFTMIDGILYKADLSEIIYVSSNISGHVVLPNGLKTIANNVFENCTGITGITIPDSVTRIGRSAFYHCSSLTNVEIPDSVTSIGNSAFESCYGLTSVVIGDGVTTIGYSVFYSCSGLTSVEIPGSVTSIGSYAFENCSSLTSVEIPGSVTSIGSYAFENCRGLTSIVIPNSVISIGNSAFSGCSSLTSVEIPDSVTSIGNSAFSGCSSLTSVEIPDSVTSIGSYAFSSCTGLTSIEIPDSVTSIGSYAFYCCNSLTSVEIPDSVTSIGNLAFGSCIGLESITVSKENTAYCSYDGILYDKPVTRFVYIPSKISGDITIPEGVISIGSYTFSGRSGLTSIVIPSSVTSIGDSAFSSCSGLTSIVIPDSVTSIGNSAFNFCTGLTSVEIPGSVTSIGDSAFYCCSSLTSVEIPGSVTSIGDSAFYGCINLTSIEIPDNVTTIGSYAFYCCSSLTSIVIPDSVTSIGSYAFGVCTGLKSIVIPNSVTTIGSAAFLNCSSLTNVEIPDSVTSIGNSAFESCYGLTSVVIGDGVTTIGYSVFYSCSGLTSIEIPDSVTSIGSYAFEHCRGLTSIVIPNSVTSIGNSAFNYCTGLTSAVIGNGVTTIGSAAFLNCSGLTSIVIPDSVTTIGSSAFTHCTLLYQIQNNSSLTFTLGSPSYGSIAYYAKVLIDKDGNKTYRDPNSGFEIIDTADGFRFVKENGEYTLCAYVGSKDTITLPASIKGNAYEIHYFRGGKNVIIPEGLISIGQYAFYGCSGLTSIIISDSVTSIGEYAFRDCSGLKNVVIGNSVSTIGSYAFYGCSGLTSIVIPDSVTTIGRSAFVNCHNLKSVVFGDGVTTIGLEAFYECSSLTSVIIPDSVTMIDRNAFHSCTGLTSVVIGNGVTSIGSNAFDNTALYNDPDNWVGGVLVIDHWIVRVKEDTEYISYDGIVGAVAGAYQNCHLLKNMMWDGEWISDLTNVETLLVPHIKGYVRSSLTLKNVVILDSVGLAELRNNPNIFKNLSGVTIYVEALEEDMRWDDNFPGWNKGNRVIYGDQWSWTTFYDADGNIISMEPRLHSQIIVQPVVNTKYEGEYAYVFAGWDLDGDGKADSVPATSILELDIRPIMEKVVRTHLIEFVGAGGTVYHSEELAYGAKINLPSEPTRKGYTFLGWSGYTDEMTADANYVFTAMWQHNGNGHAWSDSVVTAPTCTEKGYTYRICTVCDEMVRSEYQFAIGHNWSDMEIMQEATCTEEGQGRQTCLNCKEHQTVVIAANGHDFIVTELKAATCTKGGKLLYSCNDCGAEIEEVSPTTAHNYQKKKATKWWLEILIEKMMNIFFGYEGSEPYYYQCTNCGCIQTKEESTYDGGSASVMGTCNHSVGEWQILYEVSCQCAGLEAQYCTLCGKLMVGRVYSEATGHTFGDWYETKAPACTEEGTKQRDCANCDHFETDVIPANGHKHESVVTYPTCTEQGYTTHTCHCGDSYVDSYVDAKGHSFGDWHQTKAPTCTEEGTKQRDCANCDHFETDVIPANGHKYESVVTKPTCTEQGYTTHTCHCGDSYVDSYMDAKGHSFGDWYETKDPTCTEEGTKQRDCANCDHFETEEIAANGHSYEFVVTEPTCTEQGYTTHTCHCGDSYVDSYVDAKGHSFGEWYVILEPTCLDDGKNRRDCGNCDHYEIIFTAAKRHEYTLTVTAPTCTEQGYTTYTCHCGDSYVSDYVKETGHNFGDWQETKAPSCIEVGSKWHECTVCEYVETVEIPENGHDHESVVTAPTCTDKGFTTHTCHCGDSYVDSYVDAKGHTYESVVTAPTCTEQGYTTHTCHCGDSYVDSYVDAKDHSDLDGDCRCDHCDELLAAMGDINCDGVVDMKDAALLQRHVLKIDTLVDEAVLKLSDVTGDGIVDMKDAAKLTRFVIKVIDTLE